MTRPDDAPRILGITASGFATLLLGASLALAKSYDLAIETVDMRERPAGQQPLKNRNGCLLKTAPSGQSVELLDEPGVCEDSVVAGSGSSHPY